MVLEEYKKTLTRVIQMYYPISSEELSPIIDYSINKRYQKYYTEIDNSYMKTKQRMTLLQLSDWIMSKEPIVTAYGTMFKRKGTVPNPMSFVVQQFLDARSVHKKQMFQYPKGSEMFEHYNLMQSLDKIDSNGQR